MTGAILTMLTTSCGASDATAYVVTAARANGVPVELALRISYVETGWRCNLHNKKSSATGPMQILAGTARDLGYPAIRKLSCFTQTWAGMKYLAICIRLTSSWYDAARCYYAGPGVLKGKGRHSRGARIYAKKVMK